MMVIHTRSIREAKPGDLATYRRGSLKKFSEGRFFAPSERLLSAYKYRGLSWEQYERHYLAEMQALYEKFPARFLDLLKRDEITLVCYEAQPDHCHRRVLAEVLVAIAKDHGIEVSLDIQ